MCKAGKKDCTLKNKSREHTKPICEHSAKDCLQKGKEEDKEECLVYLFIYRDINEEIGDRPPS